MVKCCREWSIILIKLAEEIRNKGLKITWIGFLIICLFLFTLVVFWMIATEIVQEHENTFDLFVFKTMSSITSTATTHIMLVFTFFGSTLFLLPSYLILTSYLLFVRKNKRLSIQVATIGLTSTIGLFILKNIFHRSRPLDELVSHVRGFSFPSGHSFSSFTFFGLITYLIWKTTIQKSWKYFLSITLFLFCSLIALSRVYLHVHYASDVVAGFCLSIIWLIISLWLLNKIRNQQVAALI